jgi:hypothetical protein
VDFSNQTVVCIASGFSLTEEDCKLVEQSGLPTIVLNSSWVRARFAKILYSGDCAWWRKNHNSVDIDAEKWTSCPEAQASFGLHYFRSPTRNWNSGLRAIELAEVLGAKKVILLGYDCQIDYGVHWHDKHEGLSNPTDKVCRDWRVQFAGLAKRSKIEIINCSRLTALTCFPRAKLEDELC